jgi:hypothetical protein
VLLVSYEVAHFALALIQQFGVQPLQCVRVFRTKLTQNCHVHARDLFFGRIEGRCEEVFPQLMQISFMLHRRVFEERQRDLRRNDPRELDTFFWSFFSVLCKSVASRAQS